MITRTVALAIALFLGAGADTFAAHANTSPHTIPTIFDELSGQEVLELTIETDVSQLMENAPSEDYQSATLQFEVPGKGLVERSANIRLRGRYRRRVCAFPPLKLKFPEDALRQAGLDPVFRSLKLVTHCLEEKFEGNQNVFKEYLAYKLYNLLSEHSYRVQLVKITYLNTQGKKQKIRRYGFLLEDIDELAYRSGGEECDECRNVKPEELKAENVAVMSMFQYMIGNADWNAKMMRNLKYLRLKDSDQGLIVPYDFDFAGLVNPPYAVPNSDYGLTSIRQRLLLGPPIDDAVMKWTINYFRFKEEEIIDYVSNFRLLKQQNREDIIDFLNHFFEHMESIDVYSSNKLYERFSEEPLNYKSPSTGQDDDMGM